MPKKEPRLLKVTDIQVKATPNPHKSKKDSKFGKRHNLPYTHFVYNLLRINEMNPKAKKMTDAEIVRQIRLEYPNHPEITKRFSSPKLQSNEMSRLRSFYNNGSLIPTLGAPEKHLISFYYDEQGFACNPRYSIPSRLSNEEIEAIRMKYVNKEKVRKEKAKSEPKDGE